MTARIRLWLAATHGPAFELTRHFFLRLFDIGFVSQPGQLQKLVIGIFSALYSATSLLPVMQFRKYVDLQSTATPQQFHSIAAADRMLYLLIPMVVVALISVLHWQSLFPSGRDYLILMPLPVSRLQMFAAKFAALMLFIGLFIVASGLFPSLILPLIQENKWSPPPGPREMFAQGFATLCAALFVFFALVALQGLLMNLAGGWLYPKVTLVVQMTLLLALLCVIPQIFSIPALYRRGAFGEAAPWIPPVWFLAVGEWIRGSGEFSPLASRGLSAVAGSLAAAVLFYVISFVRQAAVRMEGSRTAAFTLFQTAPRLLMRAAGRRAGEFAIVSFVFKTLARSPQHKLILSAYFGIGFAILVNTYILMVYFDPFTRPPDQLQSDAIQAALSAPLVLSFFCISGLRVVFSIPCELQANWLFRFMETDPARLGWLNAVQTTFYAAAIVPTLLVSIPFAVTALGWTAVPAHLVVCTLLCLILVESMLWQWQKVPFVCSYLPGQRDAATTMILYWTAFGFYAYSSTTFEAWCLREPPRLLILLGLLVAAFARLRELRLETWAKTPLVFEDSLQPVVETLRISRE